MFQMKAIGEKDRRTHNKSLLEKNSKSNFTSSKIKQTLIFKTFLQFLVQNILDLLFCFTTSE